MPIPRFEHRIPGRVMPTTGRRLTGARWSRLRGIWIRRNPRCVDCGMPGEEVHHIIPRCQRPDLTYDQGNLCTLCRDCHARRHSPGKSPKTGSGG